MKILITGCAGFIGSHLTDRLISVGHDIVGVDNFNNYYDPKIKEENINDALRNKKFKLMRADILDFGEMKKIFEKERFDMIVHLAARAGVRSSIENPLLYVQVNTLGTVKLLKLAVDFNVKKFIFGSSSSVYGNSEKIPFSEDDPCQNIISPYAASKRSGEFFVESFHKNFGLKSIILRFFTAYGPRGRVDMAPFIFVDSIIKEKEISIFGDGTSMRDYTYIDDIVDGIFAATQRDLKFEIINLGNSNPVKLIDFITFTEKALGRKSRLKKLPSQPGDVSRTWANIERAKSLLDWKPQVSIGAGLKTYVDFLNFSK